MQADENSDLHPCAYFLHTFSSAQCNYDIYDHELLAVILALEEWRQYLQGTAHPITIITNHKNLSKTPENCPGNKPDGHYSYRTLTYNGRSPRKPKWPQWTHDPDVTM